MTSIIEHAAEVIEANADPRRDGGPFTFAAECPKCGLVDLHGLRAPNLEAPRALTRPEIELQTMFMALGSGRADRTLGKNWGYSRWDERPFESVRTCIDEDCGYEWGHR